MKTKRVLFMCMAALLTAVAYISCNGDDKPGDKSLDVTLTFDQTSFTKLNYGEPVNITGTASSGSSISGLTFTSVKQEGETYSAVGEEQYYKANGSATENFKMEFIPDSKAMTHIEVKANSGDKSSKGVYIAVGSVEGEAKGSVYFNAQAVLRADTMVWNNQNSPDIFPNPNTGAKSSTPSYFSIHGVNINGEKKHILSVDEVRSVEGKDVSIMFCNVLQNTANKVFIGGQRGYMFNDLSNLAGGTIGRQCDMYEIDGKVIKPENRDMAQIRRVPGSWSSGYDEGRYKLVDSLFLALGDEAATETQKLRAFYLLGKIQERLDNATLGVNVDPVNLGGQAYLRRFTDAGDAATNDMVENFRAGDYLILRSEVQVGGNYTYYYGIMQITQMYDDSRAFVEIDGKTRLGREESQELFMKPLILNIKTQIKL